MLLYLKKKTLNNEIDNTYLLSLINFKIYAHDTRDPCLFYIIHLSLNQNLNFLSILHYIIVILLIKILVYFILLLLVLLLFYYYFYEYLCYVLSFFYDKFIITFTYEL